MTVTAPSTRLSRSCSARFATRRRPERDTFGPELARIAVQLGQPFMPWQRDAAMVGCEIDPATGGPAYREVIVTVPRQSGKTTLFLSWQINRCLAPRWRHPQRSVFTAQSGKDARDKWLDELYPLIEGSRLAPFVRQMTRGMGNEYVSWKTRSLIRLLSTSASSGHSKTLHQAVLDEIWHDADDRREQGLRPAMVTVEDAQLLVCSTAGTAASMVYNRKVLLGRKAVKADTGRGVAYFEYSAPDGWDPDDEGSYFGFMPALCPDPPCRCGVSDGGWRHTVTLDVIRGERDSMEPPQFARAHGNVPTPSLVEQPINPERFAELVVPYRRRRSVAPVFFIDVAGMRSAAVGVAYVLKGRPHAELADHRLGTDWLMKRCAQLRKRHPTAVWAIEKGGAVSAFLPELTKHGIEPEQYTSQEMGRACAHLDHLVTDAAVSFCDDDAAIQAALAAAVKRDVGEGLWAWSYRRSTADISPLVGVTGALWTFEINPAYDPGDYLM